MSCRRAWPGQDGRGGRPYTKNLGCAAREWQQSDVARLLDRHRQAALMRRADAGQAARYDLPALGHKLSEQPVVLVVDAFDFLDAKLADFLAPEILTAAA